MNRRSELVDSGVTGDVSHEEICKKNNVSLAETSDWFSERNTV